ncbi:MAG: leucine-rich repeat protein, partial [Verrucomicrobiota bacterium]
MKFRSNVALAAAILGGLSILNLSAQTPQFLWAKRVASTVNPDDELAIGMAMDSATNLYVTGWFDGTNDFGGVILTNKSGGGQDIFVGKYNSDGALQWARRAGGSSASRDAGRGVGVDTNGNVYATGGFYSTADFGSINVTSTSAQSFFLTKYNSNGVAQWVRQSTNGGSAGTGSYGMALAVDASGNSYAAGCFSGVTTITLGTTTLTNTGSYNIFLVKYDNTGGVLWAKSFNSPGWSYANAVTLDSNSNVYVTGTFNPSVGIGATNFTSAGGKDGFVAKFNSAGALQWARQMAGNSDDTAQATSVDVAGNVYVCGGFGNAAGDTVSFGPGITLTNIGGGRPGAGIGDAFLAKYNSFGTPQWARRAGGMQMDVYSGVSADSHGNTYVTGGTGSAIIPGAFNVVIARYDSNGVVQWPPDATSTLALPWAGPMVDAGGNCYVAGWFQTNAVFGTNTITGPGYFDYFLAKLAPGGSAVPYTWTTNNGAITITAYTGLGGAVTIPGMLTGLPVTIIGDSAFGGSTNLTSVTIPSSVTNIESYAFQDCTNLANVTIPEGVAHIGDGAFEWCYGLTNVTIPASVTSLGDGDANGDGAFLGCTNLLFIKVDTNNLAFTSVDGILFNKSQTTLVQYPGGRAGNYTVPNSVTSIRFGAFVGCTRLLL